MAQRYTVFVKPGSKKGPLVEVDSTGLVTIYTPVRAVDGRANHAVIELFAEYIGVAQSQVRVVRGHTSRHKIIERE